MKSKQPFWIKKRDNPQLGTYYVACGQMGKREAKEHFNPSYGANTMIPFADEQSYQDRLVELSKSGATVI